MLAAGSAVQWGARPDSDPSWAIAARTALSDADDPEHSGVLLFHLPFDLAEVHATPALPVGLVPSFLYRCCNGQAEVILCSSGAAPDVASLAAQFLLHPAVDEDRNVGQHMDARIDWHDEDYLVRVRRGLDAIGRDEVRKVVLARLVHLALPYRIDSVDALARLRESNSRSFHILLAPDAGVAFLCASPERLCRVRGGMFETMALAGTTRMDTASTGWMEDLTTGKNLEEHQFVVRMLLESAESFSSDLHAETTRALPLRHLQHLLTPIHGVMRPGRDLLDAVQSLHPTPAVAGTPTDAARVLIAALEPWSRGLFAGAVGWMDAAGDGDAAVAIRSAWIRGSEAELFAGAGIVADSDPACELDETRVKLRGMLEALGASAGTGS
jgi:isochorismate synthase